MLSGRRVVLLIRPKADYALRANPPYVHVAVPVPLEQRPPLPEALLRAAAPDHRYADTRTS